MAKLIPLLATAILTLAAPVGADEITDRIGSDRARAEYNAGELRKAVQTIRFAVAGIHEKINLG